MFLFPLCVSYFFPFVMSVVSFGPSSVPLCVLQPVVLAFSGYSHICFSAYFYYQISKNGFSDPNILENAISIWT